MRDRASALGLPGRATIALAVLAATPPLVAWLLVVALGAPDAFNDFHSYWYAGRLITEGASPYDLEALHAIAARHGDTFIVGTGYSYPLPFALAMVPFAAMPFEIALVVFNGLSVAVFAATVAAWLRRFHPSAPPVRLRVAAALCGASPPVVGSVANGQVNLLVLAAVAAGAGLVLEASRTRSAIGGIAIGLAAVVKLVPGVLVVPLWLAGNRRAAAASVVAGFVVPLGLAAAVRPAASLGSSSLVSLLQPDPFVTNQSVNGFVSRLVESSDRMTALAPGAFDAAPFSAALTVALAAATVVVLWRSRRRLATSDGLALGLALGLVTATAGAPKMSLWNGVIILVAIGLLLARVAPDLGLAGLDRVERRLLATWWAGVFLQPLVWTIGPQPPGPAAAIVVFLGSLALYGSLAVSALLARRLLRAAVAAEVHRPAGSPQETSAAAS